MMNIVTAGDLHVFPGIELLFTSICYYNKEPINFYILSGDLSRSFISYNSVVKQKDYLEKVIKKYNINNTLNIIDCTKIYNKEFKPFEQNLTGGSPYAVLRLFMDLLLPAETVLYLDPDCFVLHNLKNLFRLFETDYDIGTINFDDFCSGVLGFNLKNIRADNYLVKARLKFKSHKYQLPDQMALKYAKGKFGLLPREYHTLYLNKNINFNNQYIIHCSGNSVAKIYLIEDEATEVTQEKLFGDNSPDLVFLHNEIINNRKQFNYKFIPGGLTINGKSNSKK